VHQFELGLGTLIHASWRPIARKQIADPSAEKDEKERAKLQRQLDDFKEKQDWLTKIREGLLAVLGNEAKDTDFPNPYWFSPTPKEIYLYLVDNDCEGLREWKRQCFDERDDKSKNRNRDIGRKADKIIVTNTNIGGIQVHQFELGLGRLIDNWFVDAREKIADPSTEKDEKERAKLQRQLDDFKEKQDWLTKIREGLLAVLGKEAKDTDFPNPYWFSPTPKEIYLYLVDNDFEGLREWKRQCFDERDDKSKNRNRDIGRKADKIIVTNTNIGGIQVHKFELGVGYLLPRWKRSARKKIADPSTEKDEKERAKLQRQLDDFKEKQDWLTKIREGLLAVLGNEAKDTDFPNPYWFSPTPKEKYLYLVDNDFEGLREWKRQCFDERDDKSKNRSKDIGHDDKIIVTNTNIGGIQVHQFELGLGKLIGTWKRVCNKDVSDPSTGKDEKERAKLQRQLDDFKEKQDWPHPDQNVS
jgi:hypothetical protein